MNVKSQGPGVKKPRAKRRPSPAQFDWMVAELVRRFPPGEGKPKQQQNQKSEKENRDEKGL